MSEFLLVAVNKTTYVVETTAKQAEIILQLRPEAPVSFKKVDDGKIIIIRAGKITAFEELKEEV